MIFTERELDSVLYRDREFSVWRNSSDKELKI